MCKVETLTMEDVITFSRFVLKLPWQQGFKRFVEIGRVVLINYGPHEGKLAVIIDVVDDNKVCVSRWRRCHVVKPWLMVMLSTSAEKASFSKAVLFGGGCFVLSVLRKTFVSTSMKICSRGDFLWRGSRADLEGIKLLSQERTFSCEVSSHALLGKKQLLGETLSSRLKLTLFFAEVKCRNELFRHFVSSFV